MVSMDQRSTRDFYAPWALLATIWIVFAVDWLLPWDLTGYGLVPRTARGLIGIGSMPFLHGSFSHLLSNSVPLIVLLTVLIGSRAQAWQTVIQIIVVGGGLLWLLGRSADHIGASGLIFGLIGFLVVWGFAERRPISILVSLLVAVFYGGTLIAGIVPRWNSNISWDGHLWGAVGGGLVAILESRAAARSASVP